tara:strand:- start:1655 stop:2194 length:540 start_codon:yes stop_codon:yes gene_type:complete
MDFRIAQCVLGAQEPTELEKPFVDLLKQHLALDNNKLREDFVCSLLGYTPSYGGQGYPDGYKPDGTCVDNKSGPHIVFPDGGLTIAKKIDWDVLVHQFTDNGELIYVAEVKVIDIIDELVESAILLKRKGSRVSPICHHTSWVHKPSAKVLYKNQELFERKKNGGFRKFYNLLNQLPSN